jgi:PKHD-type hydroxylase
VILSISDVLSRPSLVRVQELAAIGTFEDGRATAGWSAKLVKNNRQLQPGSKGYEEVVSLIVGAVSECHTLRIAALPRTFRPPVISRCDVGMGYGPHVDDALMGQPMVRADLSYTLFLSDPDTYEGGELVLEDTQGEQAYKLPAGCFLLYPSTYLHRVDVVRAGSRLVAAGWIQSLCRDAAHREILFDLHRLMTTEFERRGKSVEFDLLSKTRSNLLRLFADV